MKRLFYISIIAALLSSCNSQEKPADVESIVKDSTQFTTIQWKDTSVDFGTKKMGDMVNITFNCKNTGSKPMYLYEVHPSCGCTVVDYSKAPIAPGQSGKIDAQFDTKKSHPGEVHKKVYVRSNVSNHTPSALLFSGVIEASDSTKNNN